jgi:hypothetical protein
MTVVRCAAVSEWAATAGAEPEELGAPKSVWRADFAVVPVVEDVVAGRREAVAGADCVTGFALG